MASAPRSMVCACMLAALLIAPGWAAAAATCDTSLTVTLSHDVYWINHRHIPLSANVPWLSESKTPAEMFADLAEAEAILSSIGMDIRIVDGTSQATEIAEEHTASIYVPFRRIFLGASRSRSIQKLVDRLSTHGYYDDGKLNIYFVPDADVKGYHLRGPDGESLNIVLIGNGGEPDSIAHELGHAFSLQHVNFWDTSLPSQERCVEYEYWDGDCDFDRKNLMWSGWVGRNELNPGQLERAMCNPHSSIVKNGDITKTWERGCPEFSEEGHCKRVDQ